MNFVFGNTLVCKDSEAAKRVTFDQAVRARSVTLEGERPRPVGHPHRRLATDHPGAAPPAGAQ